MTTTPARRSPRCGGGGVGRAVGAVAVVVVAAPGLAAVAPGRDVARLDRRGAPARLAEALARRTSARLEADVDADEVQSSNGPMGKPPPRRTHRSIVGTSAIRSCRRRRASRPNGPVAAVDEEAGPVVARDHVLAHRLARGPGDRERRARRSASPAMTSSRRMTGGGLKKCMPTTRSGAGAPAAIAVTGSEEVLRGQHALLGDDLGEPAVEVALELHALGRGLDHELGGA